jgi:hypothetical protein
LHIINARHGAQSQAMLGALPQASKPTADELDSAPYEQAARAFRQHGYTGEADQFLMAQRRHARQVGRPNATGLRRAMEATYATIGYGYRAPRASYGR